MPRASRVGDRANCPADGHGKICCPHNVTGPAVSGSPDVFINGQPALRIGDPGVHSSCCGPNRRKRAAGSATVSINGLPAVRLDAMDDFTFTHDIRGRMTEKRCSKTGTVWKYFYDVDGKLVEAHVFIAANFTRIRFGYDALGRRATTFDGLNETIFTWDGLRLVREEHGSTATTYFYEQGSHAPLARVDSQNSLAGTHKPSAGPHKVYYYHCSPAGLPEDITDSEGEIVRRGRYSTWGKLLLQLRGVLPSTFVTTDSGSPDPIGGLLGGD